MSAYDASRDAKCRVIVMEDDPCYSKLLEVILEGVGYHVVCVADGVEGMRAMRQFGADVVITDLFMPEQDGLQTIMQLKKEFPAVRVVAMTAGATYLSLENARETADLMGADAFIEKPLSHHVLLETLQGLLPVKNGLTNLETF